MDPGTPVDPGALIDPGAPVDPDTPVDPGAPTGGPAPMAGPLPRPAEVIAHRPPFLFVDEVTEIVPGCSARGRWHLRGDEAFFGGHFPGRPTLPGVLMVEALAQLGAIALLGDDRFAGSLPLFGGIDKARFRRQVTPGDTLEMSVTLSQLGARAGRGQGVADVGGQVACQASLLFVIARPQ